MAKEKTADAREIDPRIAFLLEATKDLLSCCHGIDQPDDFDQHAAPCVDSYFRERMRRVEEAVRAFERHQ